MAERIDVPPTLQGDEKAQLQQVWSYLYQLSEAINNNLQGIGGNELTDSERQTMQMILSAGEKAQELSEVETLKSLIIKTAVFVQTSLQEYRMSLLRESVASGKFGRYVRSTGLDVAVTPEGIMQKYSFQEIIQGLKIYEINAKNYIKTGLLRTVNNIPVYGVAIGKDIVTFSQDGTETYNDGNKVAELTADELSFWQNGVKVAGYTGSRISFYYNGSEAFYIQNGKITCIGDLEIAAGSTLKVVSGGNIDIHGTGTLDLSGSDVSIKSNSTFLVESNNFKIDSDNEYFKSGDWILGYHGLYHPSLMHVDNYYSSFRFGNPPPEYNENNMTIAGEITRNYSSATLTPFDAIFRVNMNWYYGPEYYESWTRLETRITEKVWVYGYSNIGNIFGRYSEGQLGHTDGRWEIWASDVKYNGSLSQNSSKDIKHDIKELVPVGEKLDKLIPVTFVYDDDEDERQRMGLIYEDTVEVMPEICTNNEAEKAISYVELIPALLKEIQDLRKRVAELERRVDDVQGA